MEDYLEYYTLASPDDKTYQLSYMPVQKLCTVSLDIDNRLGKAYYDNPSYIYGEEFYDVIKLWVEENKVDNGEYFTEILKDIPLEDFKLILSMLDRSKELGWNKEDK